MELEAFPAVDPAVAEALGPALRGAELLPDEDTAPGPWRRAALDEAVDPDDADDDYALSPRRTRGATRA